MNTSATIEQAPKRTLQLTRQQSMAVVFCCTLFGAAAQILIKMGATTLTGTSPLAMLTNLPVFLGYSLYGFSTVFLVVALKDGELSILYPVISLTYVWVAFLSYLVFHEAISVMKMAGIAIIVMGVAVLGKGGAK